MRILFITGTKTDRGKNIAQLSGAAATEQVRHCGTRIRSRQRRSCDARERAAAFCASRVGRLHLC